MGEKLVVGPISKGLKTDREPFNIDNDSFPVLQNAYQWRGRIKRKRGTKLLGQLRRFFDSTNPTYTSTSTVTFDGSGNANLITGFSLETNASIQPGSVTITGSIGPTVFTDPTKDGFLTPTGTGGPNTINYETGAILIPAQAGGTATVQLVYSPQLPVMGLEETRLNPNISPGTMAFDTVYSYLIKQTTPFLIYDVSFYKNPASSGSYVQKTNWTRTSWNGQDYQQFWTANYSGALWATNGVNVPFSITNIGMQYAGPSTTPALTAANWINSTTMTFTVAGNPLVVGDFVFANEFTGAGTSGLNFQTGFVTVQGNTFTVVFPNAQIANAAYIPGIIQYLTNRSSTTVDCIRWFDGDPTTGVIPAVFQAGNGWVNYMPPLSQGNFSIGGLPPAQYYLAGAKMVFPFKDRLCFFGAVVQTSSPGSQVYLQDTVVFSQVGTPYYTASYINKPSATADTPTNPTITFNALLVPANQTATPTAMFEDQVGFGGFISAGLEDAITTLGRNEDGLILGFTKVQTRFLGTGDGVTPFEFFIVNSDLGSASTFSSIEINEGVFTRGSRGYTISNQTGTVRIDNEILDQVFQISLVTNGNERFTAQRDFINEWIYFTYTGKNVTWKFPNQTLLYNYRENSYAIFFESYTTYGPFTEQSGETWADLTYLTWSNWNDPWNSGTNNIFQPLVIAGNQQGYVVFREDESTRESISLSIQSFSGNTITSPNHNLNNHDFILITGCLGTIGTLVNGNVFEVTAATTNSFTIIPNPGTGTYLGAGKITRMYVPFIQTRQFPISWALGRKTRIGPQQYLLTTTNTGQITVQIYLSQDAANDFNDGPIVPAPGSTNNSLIYSQIVFTCPESTNLGLTPFTQNLNMVTASTQAQIWHRMNTSLIGDTIQLGFTLSDTQMSDPNLVFQFDEVELHAFILDVSPSMVLS